MSTERPVRTIREAKADLQWVLEHASLGTTPKLGTRRDWQMLKVLGQGCEGTVYVVEERSTNQQFVAKVLHAPRARSECLGLQAYSSSVTGDFSGLPAIDLVGDAENIMGLIYNYRPVYPVHYRILRSWRQVGQALVGSYCRMQAHLISTAHVALSDPNAGNFLLGRDGRFHWVDFGIMVTRLDESWALRDGVFGYAFAHLLLSLHFVNILDEVKPSRGYSYTQPCRYCMDTRLDALALRHRWLREVLVELRRAPASRFLEADFYRHLGEHLPDRVAAPGVTLLASRLLEKAGPVWGSLRCAARGTSQ